MSKQASTPEVAPQEAPVVDPFADLKAAAAQANAKQVMVVIPSNPKAQPALRVDH